MLLFNVKIYSKRLLAAAAAVAVALAAVCALSAVFVTSSVPDTAVSPKIGEYSLEVGDSGEADFLAQLGYEASSDEVECGNVVIPSSFNEYYEKYNELQESAGLDLSKYRGKTVQMRTVWLENPRDTKAVLLVYEGSVIGGHITTGEYGSGNSPLV